MGKDVRGLVMYENEKNKVLDLTIDGQNTTAYLFFSDLCIDLSDIARQAIVFPMSFDKMHQMMWKKILTAVEEARGDKRYSSVFTRIEVGKGYFVLRNRMTQMISFIYNRWYTEEERRESENKREYKSIYSSSNWRIGGQDNYFGN